MNKPSTTDYLLLLLQGAIWGSSFQAIKFALEDFGPVTIAAGRVLLAAILITIYAKYRGHSFPRQPKQLLLLFIVGLFNCALPFFLISWGEQELDTGRTAIFMASGPLIALGIAHFATTDDRMTRFKSTGFVMGFIGVVFVIGLDGLKGEVGELLPQLAIIGAATSYVISGAIAKRIEGIPASMFTATVLIMASIMTVPASLILEAPLELQPSQSALLALFYLGMLPTGLAFMIRFHLLRKVGYTFVSQVGYLVPMFGVIFGAIIFGEAITLSVIIGLVLILSGIVISRLSRNSFGRNVK